MKFTILTACVGGGLIIFFGIEVENGCCVVNSLKKNMLKLILLPLEKLLKIETLELLILFVFILLLLIFINMKKGGKSK